MDKNLVVQEANELMPEMERYMSCLKEIKRRWIAIQNSIGKDTNEFDLFFGTEFICLQFRSIMELIILASFSVYKKHYDSSVDLEMWHISRDVIKAIKKVNEGYYPVPIKLTTEDIPGKPEYSGQIIRDIKNPLPETSLLSIYKQCNNLSTLAVRSKNQEILR